MGLSNNVLLKENMDNLVEKDSRISSNRLPARVSSFNHIKNEWKKYLFENIEPVMNKEMVVEQPVEVSVKKPINVSETEPKKVEMKEEISSFIAQLDARLEEKVNLLLLENLPTNLIKGRAIRLRDNMYNNLISNGKELYSTKLENDIKDIASLSESNNNDTITSTPSYKETLIDVQKVSDANKDDIVADINDAMNEVPNIPLVIEENNEKVNDTVEDTIINAPTVTEPVEPVMPVEITKFEEEPVKPIVPVETVKIDREPVVIAEERTQTPEVVEEKTEEQPTNSMNVETADVDVSLDGEDKSLPTLDVLKELTAAKMLYQKSLDELNDAKQKKAMEEDEAQKAVRERIDALTRLKEMKEKVRLACEEFNQKAEDNRTSAVSILEGVNKMKSFIGDQRVAADDYNAQLEKIAKALDDGVKVANLAGDNPVSQDEVVRRM